MSVSQNKILIAGIIIVLLLTGAAYAAWSDSLTVTTVAQSGNLKVQITDYSIDYTSPYVDFTSDDIQIATDKKSAAVSVNDNYPGSESNFTMKVENVGTIPVDFEELMHDTKDVKDAKTGEYYHGGTKLNMFYNINAEYSVAAYNSSDTLLGTTPLKNTENATDWVEHYYVNNSLPSIEPGGYILVHTKVYFREDATELIENKTFKFALVPKFTQAN